MPSRRRCRGRLPCRPEGNVGDGCHAVPQADVMRVIIDIADWNKFRFFVTEAQNDKPVPRSLLPIPCSRLLFDLEHAVIKITKRLFNNPLVD